jgi:endonuclease YncB( thermonuclease family)
MAEDQPVGRRTVLGTLGTAAAVATGASTASAATAQHQRSPPGETDDDVGTDLTGLYSGTVDRVVDGDHVVILVESGGSVVDQYVVPKAEYPSLDEGDPVYLVVLFGSILALWEARDA